MEFVDGRKVTALGPLARLEMDGAPLAEELCQAYLHQILVDGFFHADPHPGNIFLTDECRIAFLDLGMVAQIGPGMQETLLNVDKVARRLDPDFDPNAAIRRNASEIMRHRMLKSLSPGRMFDNLLEIKAFMEKLPRRLNQLVDAVADNRLRIRVEAINEALLMEGLQKIANRITIGLVISAMIIGAALLMRIETSFRILGYPGLAILFFLAAGIAAAWLVANIVLHDMRASKGKLRAKERRKERDPASHHS